MAGFKLEASPKKKPFGITSCEAAHEAAREAMPNRALILSADSFKLKYYYLRLFWLGPL